MRELVEGFRQGNQFETLLGVTGSGKTFTMANVIQALNKPTLIIAHNKTLAGQLYGEMKEFFPEKCRGIFCLLLRLLSAGGLRAVFGYLYCQGVLPSMMRSINCVCHDSIPGGTQGCGGSGQRVLYLWSGKPRRISDLIVSLRPGMVKDRDEVLRN